MLLFFVLVAGSAGGQVTKSYQYDSRGRLISAGDGAGWKTEYALDAAGNRERVVAQDQFVKSYEAESLPHVVGFGESGGWAANVQTPSGFMIYGPYATDTPVGQRVATFKAMIDVIDAPDSNILNLDVYDATSGQLVASRILKRSDWRAPFSYQVFELPFDWPAARAGHMIEIRVYYLGTSYARVDKVGYY